MLNIRSEVLNRITWRMCFLAATLEKDTSLRMYAALSLVVIRLHLTPEESEIDKNNAVLLTLMGLVIWHGTPSLLEQYADPFTLKMQKLVEVACAAKNERTNSQCHCVPNIPEAV